MTLVTTKKKDRLPSALEDLFNDRFFGLSPFFRQVTQNGSLVPDANIIENPEHYVIELAAPGLDREDFNVEVKNGILNISAEKEEETKEESKNFRKREFSFNSFTRSFALPENLAIDNIFAKYKNGVLQLTLPKKEISPATPSRHIEVL